MSPCIYEEVQRVLRHTHPIFFRLCSSLRERASMLACDTDLTFLAQTTDDHQTFSLSSPSSTLRDAKLHLQLYARDSFRNFFANGSEELYRFSNACGSAGRGGRTPFPFLQHIPLDSLAKSLAPQWAQGSAILMLTPPVDSRAASRACWRWTMTSLRFEISSSATPKTAWSKRFLLAARSDCLRWRRRVLMASLLVSYLVRYSLVDRGIVGISRAMSLVPSPTWCVGSALVCDGPLHWSAVELCMRLLGREQVLCGRLSSSPKILRGIFSAWGW